MFCLASAHVFLHQPRLHIPHFPTQSSSSCHIHNQKKNCMVCMHSPGGTQHTHIHTHTHHGYLTVAGIYIKYRYSLLILSTFVALTLLHAEFSYIYCVNCVAYYIHLTASSLGSERKACRCILVPIILPSTTIPDSRAISYYIQTCPPTFPKRCCSGCPLRIPLPLRS